MVNSHYVFKASSPHHEEKSRAVRQVGAGVAVGLAGKVLLPLCMGKVTRHTGAGFLDEVYGTKQITSYYDLVFVLCYGRDGH